MVPLWKGRGGFSFCTAFRGIYIANSMGKAIRSLSIRPKERSASVLSANLSSSLGRPS